MTVYSKCSLFGLFGKQTKFDPQELCGFETKFELGKCVATSSTCSDIDIHSVNNNFEKLRKCSDNGCSLSYAPTPGENIHDVDLSNSYCIDRVHCSSDVTGQTLGEATCDAHPECTWTDKGCEKAKKFSDLTLRSDCGFLGVADIFNINRTDPSTFCGTGAYFNTSRNVCESVYSRCPENYVFSDSKGECILAIQR